MCAWNYEIEPILNGAGKPNEEGFEALQDLILMFLIKVKMSDGMQLFKLDMSVCSLYFN